MSKGLICDRCGEVVKVPSLMNQIEICPYVSMRSVSAINVKTADLCEDCTETIRQYILNEVQMVLYKDREAADDTKGTD